MNLHGWLSKYHALGWRTIPIKAGSKEFKASGSWADIREREWRDEDYEAEDNVGLDPASANLVDVDLDCWEAVAIGEIFLEGAPYVFGRNAKPKSHLLHFCADAPEEDVKLTWQSEVLLELRTGASGHSRLPPR